MRVVVTSRRFPDRDPYSDLVAEYDGEVVYGDCVTVEEAAELCEGADVIIGGLVPVTAEVMDAAGDLELIQLHAAGYDMVDVREASARGIPVCNAPGYAPHAVAGHAMALALAAAHEIPDSDRRIRARPGWDRGLIQPLHGGTMGIVGFGTIGRKVVPKARGFDMDVLAYDPYLTEDVFELMEVERASFDDVVSRADCLTVHAPLTDVTHHMFSTEEFERMKDSAVFVNAARGPIVDEAALVSALENGEIRAAGLDVFETEPPDGSPLLELDSVALTPHIAGATRDAHDVIIEMVRSELRRVFEGQPVENLVNPEVYQYTGGQITKPRKK